MFLSRITNSKALVRESAYSTVLPAQTRVLRACEKSAPFHVDLASLVNNEKAPDKPQSIRGRLSSVRQVDGCEAHVCGYEPNSKITLELDNPRVRY